MIRKAKISDLKEIELLMKSVKGFWDKSWRENAIELGIKASNGLSFVYEENKKILGFICAHDLGYRAYISELIVSPKVQGKGIGTELNKQVEWELEKNGCKIIIADVWKEADKFYKKLGWSKPDVILLRKKL